MAKKYTLEDVETLRGKAGVSYEEAVALLDKYDGDITRALIELEKRGQLNAGRHLHFSGEDVRRLWQRGLDTRLIVERNGRTFADLSILFLLPMLVLGPYAVAAAAVIVLVTGCKLMIRIDETSAPSVMEEVSEESAQEAQEAPISSEQPPQEEESQDGEFPHITIE